MMKEINPVVLDEELEARYVAFKVECERIRHKLDVMEQELDEQDTATATVKPRKGFVWRLFKEIAA